MAKAVRIIFYVALFFIGLTAALPTVLSTRLAKDYLVVPYLEYTLGGTVEVERIKFRWLGNQEAGHFHWTDGKDSMVRFDSLAVRAPLYSLLLGHNWAPAIETENVSAFLSALPCSSIKSKLTPLALTVTEIAGPTVDLSVTQEINDMHIVAASENGNADLYMKMTSCGPVFTRKGTIVYTMPSDLSEKFKTSNYPALDAPLEISVLKGKGFKFRVNDAKASLPHEADITHLKGVLTLANDFSRVEVALTGVLNDNGGDSDLSLTGTACLAGSMDCDLKLEGKRLRPSLITHFTGKKNQMFKTLAKSLFGSNIDGSVRLIRENGKQVGVLKLSSDLAEIPEAIFTWSDSHIKLADPLNMTVNYVQRAGVSAILPRSLPVTLQVSQFSMKLSDDIKPADVTLQSTISVREIELGNLPCINQCHLTNALLTVDGPSLENLHVSLIGRMNRLDEENAFSRALGEELRFKLTSELAFSENFVPLVQHMHFNGEDGQLLMNLEGAASVDQPLEMTVSGHLNYMLTPERLNRIQDLKERSYYLSLPATFQVVLEKAIFRLDDFALSKINSNGQIFIDEIAVGGSGMQPIASLRNVSIPWSADAESDELTFSLDAVTASKNLQRKGNVAGHAKVLNWTGGVTGWNVNAETAITAFPVAIISALTGVDELEILVGQYLDSELRVSDESGGRETYAAFLLTGDQFGLQGALKAGENLVLEDPENPVVIEWEMTPERFTGIRKALLGQDSKLIGQLALHQTTTARAEISELKIPLTSPSRSSATVELATDKIYVLDTLTNEMIFFNGISAKAGSQDLSQTIEAQFDAQGNITNEKNDELRLSFKSVIKDMLLPGGAFNRQGASINVQASAYQAPPLLLSNFLCIDKSVVNQIDALIGPKVNAQMNVSLSQMTGPVLMKVNGGIGKFSLDGYLSHGVLTLRSPFSAEFSITPSLQNSILDEILPFLNSAYSSEQPIRVTIDPNGFAYPLWDENPYRFSVGAMKIDLGKIHFKTDQQIAQILSILKYSTNQGLISIWFTPLYLSYHDGLANIARMDMLVADLFPIAVWGNVNFIQDYINMKLGLGGQTLRRAFKLKGVPKDYYLQVSMKGNLSDPSINSNKASTKIAAFIAQLRGGPQGVIVGGILDLIGGSMGQKKIPKPTTKPFPWETAASR